MSHAARFVTVAHGTRFGPGNDVARAITEAAAGQLDLPGVTSYVELCEPSFASVMAGSTEPTVVVPLLLSTGFHVTVDLPEAVAGARGQVAMGQPLGPDPLLAHVQVARLLEAGAVPGQPVVLVAAGSSDAAATADQEAAVAHLADAWDGPVSLATLSGHGRRPAEVVRPGDAVSPYLLAPGFFADRVVAQSPGAGVVADVMGAHSSVVDLVVERVVCLRATLASL